MIVFVIDQPKCAWQNCLLTPGLNLGHLLRPHLLLRLLVDVRLSLVIRDVSLNDGLMISNCDPVLRRADRADVVDSDGVCGGGLEIVIRSDIVDICRT